MPKYNKKFDLTPDDMDLIETAVRTATANDRIDPREAEDLLGRLHNQIVFYRPKDAGYISG